MSNPIRCFVCDSGADNIHIEPAGTLHSKSNMAICKTCGNIFHLVPTGSDADKKMKDYYRYNYRPAPNIGNLITTGNKLGYVKMWIDPTIAKLREEVGDRPLVGADIGCATGYIVNYLRKIGVKATGCDYTVTFRRFAEHFYGTPVTEELEPKHKYDFLSMYHVLEHIPEPDKILSKYVSMLSDNGRMFISVPEWLDTLEEASGSEMASFDHLFHKDHINVFTVTSLKNLFAKCGLVVEKEDHIQYGQTYILSKAKSPEARPALAVEPWEKQLGSLKTAKDAINDYAAKDYKSAIHRWPKFPEAHLKLIMDSNGKDPQVQAEMFEAIRPILGDNMRVMRTLGVWLYQNQEYDGAIQVLEQVQATRPNAEVWVWLGWCYREKGEAFYKKAMAAFFKAIEQDPRKWADMMGAICALAHKLPAWDEVATARAKEALFAQSGRIPDLIDPVMEPERVTAKTAS